MAEFTDIYVDKIEIDDRDIKNYVTENFTPEIFPKDELEYWAESNGYIKEEEE